MKDNQPNLNANDELDDIRAEYKEAKRKLEKYDTLADNNQMVILFLFILVAIGGIVVASVIDSGRLARSGVLYASVAMFILSIVFAVITGARQSSKKGYEQKIEKLRREVVLFQKNSGGAQNQQRVTRDELGLFEGIQAKRSPKQVVIGFFVVVVALVTIILPVVIAQGNAVREENARREEQAKQEQDRKEAQDRYYQQQQDALNLDQNQPTRCVSSGIGSTVFTNCY